MIKKKISVKRFGLHLVSPRGKHSVKYVRASTPGRAKMNYYSSPGHFRTENSVVAAVRVPAGKKLELFSKKRK